MRFWSTLGSLLQTILYGWVVALWRLVGRSRHRSRPAGSEK
jgi:hypothetical protein